MTNIENLDLREIMPFERHELIFEKWNALESGETLRIINDHDPKPLRYQFEAEYKGKYEWEYEQQGPKDWKVRIKKTQEASGSSARYMRRLSSVSIEMDAEERKCDCKTD